MAFQPGNFAGKRILVTGAGQGIGRALVEKLHSLGSFVYALSRSEERLQSLKTGLGNNLVTICVNIGNADELKSSLENIDRVDVVVNNAGICEQQDFLEISPESFDKHINVNVRGALIVSQIMSKKMIQEGKPGTIVNITSTSAKHVFPSTGSYAMSKSALDTLGKLMAISLGPHQITVNSVRLGILDTNMVRNCLKITSEEKGIPEEILFQGMETHFKSRTLTGSAMVPMSEAINAILFMASGQNKEMTGTEITIDCGYTLS